MPRDVVEAGADPTGGRRLGDCDGHLKGGKLEGESGAGSDPDTQDNVRQKFKGSKGRAMSARHGV